MKKLLIMTAVAVLGFTNGNAQDIKFGAKAGLNLASITGDDVNELDGRTSFHVGAVAEFMISDKFSVQPELLYSAQGASIDSSESFDGLISASVEGAVRLDYLNLPIMAKYYITEGLSIEAGPQIGFLLNSEAELDSTVTFNGMTETESETQDTSDDTKSIDFALGFGLGYKLDNGLNFSARYTLGLANINDFDNAPTNQNNVFQLSVGYFFN